MQEIRLGEQEGEFSAGNFQQRVQRQPDVFIIFLSQRDHCGTALLLVRVPLVLAFFIRISVRVVGLGVGVGRGVSV